MARVPKVKLDDLNNDRSTIGWLSVISQITQATKPTTATSASTTMAEEANQSASLPVSSITCRAPTQISSSMNPVRSIGSLRVGVSRAAIKRQHRKLATSPTGTLIRKIHGQLKLSDM